LNRQQTNLVMAGLDPAIHVFAGKTKGKDVDGPIKSGHDDLGEEIFQTASKTENKLSKDKAASSGRLYHFRSTHPPIC
jgi:hypothetical protein